MTGYCTPRVYPSPSKRSSSTAITTNLFGSIRLESLSLGSTISLASQKTLKSVDATSVWLPKSYDSILVIVDRLTKMVHYELVKVTIDAPGLAEVILDVVVRHHGLPDSIITDRVVDADGESVSILK